MRLFLALALLGAVSVPVPGSRAADSRAGKIVYSRKDGDRVVLHTISPDGSGDAVLPGQTGRLSLLPAGSPDGTRIAYASGEPREGFQVVVSNADGSDRRTLDRVHRIMAMPAWSPDSKQLAFSTADGAVYVSDADGGNSRRLNKEGSKGYFPFWTRDAKSVGYTEVTGPDRGEIVLAKVDSSSQERLALTGKIAVAGANAVSPDGRRLLFLAVDAEMKQAGVHIWDFGTKSETGVLDLDVGYAEEIFLVPIPAWGPDGKSVLVPIPGDKGRGLFRVSDDGKTRTRITPEGVDCFSGCWIGGR
jgi:Tol biopolymer transport system component